MATITKDKDIVIKNYFKSFVSWIKNVFTRNPAPEKVQNNPGYFESEEYEEQKIREMGRKRIEEVEYQARRYM